MRSRFIAMIVGAGLASSATAQLLPATVVAHWAVREAPTAPSIITLKVGERAPFMLLSPQHMASLNSDIPTPAGGVLLPAHTLMVRSSIIRGKSKGKTAYCSLERQRQHERHDCLVVSDNSLRAIQYFALHNALGAFFFGFSMPSVRDLAMPIDLDPKLPTGDVAVPIEIKLTRIDAKRQVYTFQLCYDDFRNDAFMNHREKDEGCLIGVAKISLTNPDATISLGRVHLGSATPESVTVKLERPIVGSDFVLGGLG